MSHDSFKEILIFLRFDIRPTQSTRLQTEKISLLSDVWDRFVANCIASNRPNDNITIDEVISNKSKVSFHPVYCEQA